MAVSIFSKIVVHCICGNKHYPFMMVVEKIINVLLVLKTWSYQTTDTDAIMMNRISKYIFTRVRYAETDSMKIPFS